MQFGFFLVLTDIITFATIITNRFVMQTSLRRMSAGVAFLMAILVVVLFNSAPNSLNWLPAITGFIVATFWLVSAARVGLLRFYVLATESMLLGAAFTFANIGVLLGVSAYYFGMGLLLVGSGGITLTKYLRQSQSLEGDPRANENTAEPV